MSASTHPKMAKSGAALPQVCFEASADRRPWLRCCRCDRQLQPQSGPTVLGANLQLLTFTGRLDPVGCAGKIDKPHAKMVNVKAASTCS